MNKVSKSQMSYVSYPSSHCGLGSRGRKHGAVNEETTTDDRCTAAGAGAVTDGRRTEGHGAATAIPACPAALPQKRRSFHFDNPFRDILRVSFLSRRNVHLAKRRVGALASL